MVLEELGIHHEEHVVPLEVLATIEEKKKKATAKNVTAAAESKKRKGIGGPKVIAKKPKVAVAVATSASSSASGSAQVFADAEEVSAEHSGGGPTLVETEVERVAAPSDAGGSQEAEDVSRSEPSMIDPMLALLGGDSSSAGGMEDVWCGGALPSPHAEAVGTARRCPATIEIEDVSNDEAVSQPPLNFRSVTFQSRPQRSVGIAGADAGEYHLHLSKLPSFFTDFDFFVFVHSSFLQVLLSRRCDQRSCELRRACRWHERRPRWAGVASALSTYWGDSPTDCS